MSKYDYVNNYLSPTPHVTIIEHYEDLGYCISCSDRKGYGIYVDDDEHRVCWECGICESNAIIIERLCTECIDRMNRYEDPFTKFERLCAEYENDRKQEQEGESK